MRITEQERFLIVEQVKKTSLMMLMFGYLVHAVMMLKKAAILTFISKVIR